MAQSLEPSCWIPLRIFSPSFIEIGWPQLNLFHLPREHGLDADEQRVGDGDDGALPPPARGQAVEGHAEIGVPFANSGPAGFDERFAQHLIALAEPVTSAMPEATPTPTQSARVNGRVGFMTIRRPALAPRPSPNAP